MHPRTDRPRIHGPAAAPNPSRLIARCGAVITSNTTDYDAVVIGSGPNGLAAAITMARHGCRVAVFESSATPGGGMRSTDCTLPGFHHDVCSAVYPLAAASPFFRTLPFDRFGLEWLQPPIAVAHPFDDGTAAYLAGTIESSQVGSKRDLAAYSRMITPFVDRSDTFFEAVLHAPLAFRHPALLSRFARHGLRSAASLSARSFECEPAKGLLAGLAAHAVVPLSEPMTAGVALVLAVAAHSVGWPIPKGGAGEITKAMVAYLTSLGGEVICNHIVESHTDLPSAKAFLYDVGPGRLARLVGERFPSRYRDKLLAFRYGPGVFKIDWALENRIPFTATVCDQAATVHLGGSFADIADSERLVWHKQHPANPFVLLSQPSVFDPARAPEGRHTAWAYCHVPSGSTIDMTEAIEHQVDRYAPGFRKLILARHTMSTRDFAAYNPNFVGGDIGGGVHDWRQLLARPVLRRSPYTTPLHGVYLCSASTPPGGGVHGMCGFLAAQAAIRDCF